MNQLTDNEVQFAFCVILVLAIAFAFGYFVCWLTYSSGYPLSARVLRNKVFKVSHAFWCMDVLWILLQEGKIYRVCREYLHGSSDELKEGTYMLVVTKNGEHIFKEVVESTPGALKHDPIRRVGMEA